MAEGKGKGGAGKQSGLRNERGREREKLKHRLSTLIQCTFIFPPTAPDFFYPFSLLYFSPLSPSYFSSFSTSLSFSVSSYCFCCHCPLMLRHWHGPSKVSLPTSLQSVLFSILSYPLIFCVPSTKKNSTVRSTRKEGCC